jgi:hypothetical protein
MCPAEVKMNEILDSILNKTVLAIAIDSAQNFIRFNTETGTVIWEAVGECCSETWFADVIGISALLGQKVLTAEFIDIPYVDDGRTRDEVDDFYGIKLTTDKGSTEIIFRNSSNGYYGGYLTLFTADASHLTFQALTADYSA